MLKRMNLSNSCEKQEEIHDVEKSEVSTIDPKKPIRGGKGRKEDCRERGQRVRMKQMPVIQVKGRLCSEEDLLGKG